MHFLGETSLLTDLINDTARNIGVLPEYVEKDYWAICVLKEIVFRKPDIVFKGGTSLSKCHRIIHRFSEDIDLSCSDRYLTQGQRRKNTNIVRESIASLGLETQNAEQIHSRRVFNRFILPYNSSYPNTSINKTVIVELATQTPSFPIVSSKVQSFIGEHLSRLGRDDVIAKYGLESFAVTTQSLERTFVDKVFAICDYSISIKLDRQSRHIYDLRQILPLISLDEKLVSLFHEVREYRIPLPTCYSAQPGMKLHRLLSKLIGESTFESDYQSKTYPLLYDQVRYESCVPSLLHIQKFLEDNDL